MVAISQDQTRSAGLVPATAVTPYSPSWPEPFDPAMFEALRSR